MRFSGWFGAAITLLTVAAGAFAQRSNSEKDKFVFWQISDTRVSTSGDVAPLRQLMQEAESATERPAGLC